MPELPQGTVTFAFTDIEGSTALLRQLGNAYAGVLSDHRRLVRGAFSPRGGVEIDTQGDAFFYAFPRARDAVAAAAEVQRAHAAHPWPDGISVRVRIGLHTGEPLLAEEGYVGLDVVRAARLCGSCRGGQVLLSQVTMALAGSGLPEGVDAFRIGERALKGIEEPEMIYELAIEGVPVQPEPAPSGNAPPPDAEPAGGEAVALDQESEEWEARLESAIKRSVYDSLERSFSGRAVDLSSPVRSRITALFDDIESEGPHGQR